MKTRTIDPLTLLLICSILVSPVWAMPPHPELLQRIRRHEIPEPYYLQHNREIRARGVESPTRCSTIDLLRQKSLDDNVNIIVILVDFSDHGAHTPAASFDSLLYGHHQGTLHDYYAQVSYGNMMLVTVNMPDALGWRRAPQTYAYYVDGQNGFGQYPRNAQRLAEDAVHLVDSTVDFSQYDNDGDGYVDALFIVHTGPGAERTGRGSDIWSHKWQMQNPAQVDGVTADVYSMEPEYWDSYGDMTCGVYAHEMGHSVFGLPDLYDYDYDSEGLGYWSLMAGGSWNGSLGASPSNPDAWCRIVMGFASATRVTSNLSNATIPAIERSPVIFRLWTDGQQGNEYFLVENRQQTAYDHALPSNGLFIYHVDDGESGNDNQWYPGHTDAGHYQVALEQADGQWNLERNNNSGDGGDPYPGGMENHSFSLSSIPSSEDYNFADTHVSVRHISNSADTMHASFYVSSSANSSPIFVWMPDSSVTSGGSLCVPVNVENSFTGRNVTAFQFSVQFDPALLSSVAPYYNRANGIIPPAWNVSAAYTSGGITVVGGGSAPLAGQGTLLCLQLMSAHSAPDNAASLLRFTLFTFNQGTPSADTTNGRIAVLSPRIEVRPAVVNLGVARVGTHVVYDAFVMCNNGTADLIVDSLRPPWFITEDFHGPQTIGPNRWYPVRIQFAPQAAQFFQDTLLVFSSAYGSPARVPVYGRGGIPALESSVTLLDFDTVGIGRTAERVINLSDTGYWPTTVTNVQFASGSAFQMIPSPQMPDTVPARGTHDYTVRFTPSLGLCADTLIISNDAGAPLRIALTGVGAILRAADRNNISIPTVFGLSQNYPNPFNPATALTFDVPRSAWVTLRVYDVLGRAVDTPVNGRVQPGRYPLQWSCSSCGSGIYFFVLSAEGAHFTQKAMLLR